MVENVYQKNGVQMQPIENIRVFMDQLKIMQGDRPLLMSQIQGEVNKQAKYIDEQLDIIKGGLEKFKRLVL